jgi:hypothetical protein
MTARTKRVAATRSATPRVATVADQVAVRFRPGEGGRVEAALRPHGRVEVFPSHRVAVLQRAKGVPRRVVTASLARLQADGLVEFVTTVLRDPTTKTRQVLTDEIVVRLKPGRGRRALSALEKTHGIAVERRNEFEPSQYIVRVPDASGTHTLEVARGIDASDDVEFAAPNYLTSIQK